MTELDLEVNTILMREMGLEIGNGNRIVDQDTGLAINIRGMGLMAPGCYGGSGAMEFDPHNNNRLMRQLFGYFLNKYSDECDIDVMTYYNVGNGDKTCVECKMDNNSTIRSKPYLRDSLKYADIIIQLNGEESPDLSKYDIAQERSTVRKGGRNAKNKPNSKTAINSK